MAKDYYQVLGIEKTDDQALIKKAYREKAKTLHPDKSDHPNAQTIFQELNEAYMVLSDPEKKAHYDEGSRLPDLTYEQVMEELRRRKQYYWDRDMVFRYQGNNVYPPTDYLANKKNALIANLIIGVISLIFLVDLSFVGKEKNLKIESVYHVYSGTQNQRDLNIYKIFMENAEVILSSAQTPAVSGEVGYITFSLIFQKPKSFRTSSGISYDISGRYFVLWISLFVLLVSVIGTMPFLSPERQFNAAVISGFFSVLLLISLIFA